jgi:integrase
MMVTFTGMRSGELLGLQWGDLQLPSGPDADGKVFVRRSLSWGRYRAEDEHLAPRFYEPKTKSGKREIPIPAALVRELKTWRLPRAPVAVRFSIPGAGRFAVSSERVELARIVARIEAG